MNLFKRKKRAFFQKPVVEKPNFTDTEIVRYHFRFTGIVQGVGFRFEVYQLAEELHLTGWARNRSDGSVEAEIQGPQDRIDYLIRRMKSIPRISIESLEQKPIPVKSEDTFMPVY